MRHAFDNIYTSPLPSWIPLLLLILSVSFQPMDPSYGSEFSAGDIGFILICMALVWLMIPGIGYFYSGMARSKNALSLIMCCVLSLVVVTVQASYPPCLIIIITTTTHSIHGWMDWIG